MVRGALKKLVRSRLVWAAVAAIVAGLVLSQLLAKPDHGWETLAERFGDALIIAGVIVLLIEAPGIRQISQRILEGGLWGFINPEAPRFHQELLRRLAAKKAVIDNAEWVITLDPHPDDDKLLCLTISLATWGRTFGQNVSWGKTVVLASSEPHSSKYLGWKVRQGDGGPILLELTQAELAGAEVLEDQAGADDFLLRRHDGSLELDIDLAMSIKRSPRSAEPGSFHGDNEMSVIRHKRGFFPMWFNYSVDKTSITLQGAALETHRFKLARLDDDNLHHDGTMQVMGWDKSKDGPPKFEVELLPPHCALILSWGPVAGSSKEDV